MELVRVHNFAQAEKFLQQAMKMNHCDPLIWNELGVISLRNKQYDKSLPLSFCLFLLV